MGHDLDDKELAATREELFGRDKGKIEIGEYVRTDDGLIRGEVTKVDDYAVYTKLTHFPFVQSYLKDKIKKHSKNIKDLIEVGDFINRNEVVEIKKGKHNEVTTIVFRCPTIIGEIVSILTHEQYERDCYKGGWKDD